MNTPKPMNNTTERSASLVPKGITLGLAAFAVILALAGFGFRLYLGERLATMWPNILMTALIFWVLIPAIIVAGAMLLNRFSGKAPIQTRNALTLGLLLSCVAMLWMMSVYS